MRSTSKRPWVRQPEAARLPTSDRPKLKLGMRDARWQWQLLREAFSTAPDYFQRFLRRITAAAAVYFVLLFILMGVVIAGVPVDNWIQGLAVFGTATVVLFYQNAAGPLLQYHKTHGGKPDAPAEIEPDQWQAFRKAFWWSAGVGAGGTALFTVVGTWLASVYAYLGLPNTILIAAIAQPWQIAYGLFATYIFGRGSRKLSAEAKAAREAGRKLREGITWRQRRAYRRQAKPFMGRLWPQMIAVTLLFWLTPALLVLKFRPSSRWQSLLLVWFLQALVTFAQKVCVEPYSTRVQLRATKGYDRAFPEDYVWCNAGTFDLLRTAVRDLCNMWLVNGVVTLVLDGGLNNQSSLMHYCLNLVLTVVPGTVLSALIAGWPARADQVVAQVAPALSGGAVLSKVLRHDTGMSLAMPDGTVMSLALPGRTVMDLVLPSGIALGKVLPGGTAMSLTLGDDTVMSLALPGGTVMSLALPGGTDLALALLDSTVRSEAESSPTAHALNGL